jgi:hypothetical protein
VLEIFLNDPEISQTRIPFSPHYWDCGTLLYDIIELIVKRMLLLRLHVIGVQALPEESDSWNRSAAEGWLLSHQGPDGAFFDVQTTAEVVLALSGKSLMSVSEVDCDKTARGKHR